MLLNNLKIPILSFDAFFAVNAAIHSDGQVRVNQKYMQTMQETPPPFGCFSIRAPLGWLNRS
jgi:hypothetical protein